MDQSEHRCWSCEPMRVQYLTIGETLLDLTISIFDQGNEKTGYLLDICMIVMWYLRDIAKLSSSGQVVMKFNLN